MNRGLSVGRVYAPVAVVLACATFGSGLGASSAAAKAAGPQVQILAPTPGTTHVGSRPLRVRVRIAPGVRDVRAIVTVGHDRDVTARLEASSHGVRSGTLRVGRELRHGPNSLRVVGRRGKRLVADTTYFWVASRRAKLVTVKGLPRRVRRAPLHLSIRVGKAVDRLHVRVDGRNATGVLAGAVRGVRRGTLSADEGLRFGRNRVVVTAASRNGTYQRVTHVVRLDRGSPLVGAGKDRITRVRARVRLNGSSTLPRHGDRLRLTWRIVSRPKGSRARLRNIHALRPSLRTDRPGRYRIRLTAVPRPRRRSLRAAQAAPSTPASDVTSVSAQPSYPPPGAPVQTIGNGPTAQVTVAGQTRQLAAGDAVLLLDVDGTSLTVNNSWSFPGTDQGINDLIAQINGIQWGDFVILASPSSASLDISAVTADAFDGTLQGLGINPNDRSVGRFVQGAPAPGWSVVSMAGGAPGVGRGLFGMTAAPDGVRGEMDGYMTHTSTLGGQLGSGWVFRWANSYEAFNTQAAGSSPSSNTMTLTNVTGTVQSFTSDPSVTTGYHLVWLDAGTLAKLGEATIPDGQGTQLAQQLTNIDGSGSPVVLMLTTIGHPTVPRNPWGATNGWATVAHEITSFGGNANAFLALDGSGNSSYSLVGATGIGDDVADTGIDVSTKLNTTVATPQLVGVLSRGLTGMYRPSTGGAPNGPADVEALQPGIQRVLAEPDEAFPSFTGTAAQAEQAIANYLGLPNTGQSGIRANYWDLSITPSDWSDYHSDVQDYCLKNAPPNNGQPAGYPCSSATKAVQAQLATEFNDVVAVRSAMGLSGTDTYYGALQNEIDDGLWSFDSINAYIKKLYPPQPTPAHGPSPLDIVEGMLDAASSVAPEGGEVIGVAGAAMEIGGALADQSNGSAYLGATKYDAVASDFAAGLEQQFDSSLSGLALLQQELVGDWGRLQAAATALGPNGAWDLSDANVAGAFDRGVDAYMWQALLPTTFEAYQCVVPPVYYPPEDFRPAPWYPHSIKPNLLSFTPFTTVTHHPNPYQWGYASTDGSQIADGFLTIGRWFDGEHHYLDRNVVQELFGPVSNNQPPPGVPYRLGLIPQYLLAGQQSAGSPGFHVNQGSFNPRTDVSNPSYVEYTCAGNEWREDVNQRGQ